MIRIPKTYAMAIVALAILLAIAVPTAAKEVKGTVTSLLPDDLVFTMTDEEGIDHTLRLRADGKVIINQEERTLAELQSGDNVTVDYEMQDMDMVATRIRVTRE